MIELTKELLAQIQEIKSVIKFMEQNHMLSQRNLGMKVTEQDIIDANYQYGYYIGYRDALNEAIRVHRRIK